MVYVNGAQKGITPLTISGLSPGSVELKVVLDGYESVEDTMQIVAGKEETMNYTLARVAVAPPTKPGTETQVKPPSTTTSTSSTRREWKRSSHRDGICMGGGRNL